MSKAQVNINLCINKDGYSETRKCKEGDSWNNKKLCVSEATELL